MLIFVTHEHREMKREDSREMDKSKWIACYVTPVSDNSEWGKGPPYEVTVLPVKTYFIRWALYSMKSHLFQVTSGFELYVTFEPLITKHSAINAVNKLLRWIKKEEERLFILNAPTF
jgi:hypothetical protein